MSTYEFGNGSSVVVESPWTTVQGITLEDPTFLGAGSGGAVFSYKQQQITPSAAGRDTPFDTSNGRPVVVKYSWVLSAQSVKNECAVLREMEKKHVSGVERCIGELDYQPDPSRSVIIMEPLIEDGVSSVQELSTETIQSVAIQALMRTFVEMLSARVVTTDVQVLISQRSGDAILIDMTEAKILPNDGPLSDTDRALVNDFCTEMMTLIPESLFSQASDSFRLELHKLEQVSSGAQLDQDILDIIHDLPQIEN
jgi:hypothetical protein